MIELIGWVATMMLLVGYYFNARRKIYSWIIWLFGNNIMFFYALLIQSYSIAFLSAALACLNIYGYVSWKKNK